MTEEQRAQLVRRWQQDGTYEQRMWEALNAARARRVIPQQRHVDEKIGATL